MKKKVGWKLVRKHGKNWCSVFSAVKKIYKDDKINWRRKGCGPMALFDNRKDAIRYGDMYNGCWGELYLVLVRYRKSKESSLYYPIKLLGKKAYQQQGRKNGNNRRASTIWENSVFADSLYFLSKPKPIRQIHSKEIN